MFGVTLTVIFGQIVNQWNTCLEPTGWLERRLDPASLTNCGSGLEDGERRDEWMSTLRNIVLNCRCNADRDL